MVYWNNISQRTENFHNTETALLKIRNDLLEAGDNRDVSLLTLLDLSAAFDTIDHNILLKRLEVTFGFSGVVLAWFKSYIIGRTQCISINGTSSSNRVLEFGVPQGSVLGPFLYTVYTVPIGAIISYRMTNYHIYADDKQLYPSAPAPCVNAIVSKVEKCTDDVNSWMVSNKLKMNEEKTEAMLCNVHGVATDVKSITVGNDVIQLSKNAKNLGVVF